MPTPIDWDAWKRYKATIEECLRQGFAPFRAPITGGRGSAVGEARRRLQERGENLKKNTLPGFIRTQERRQEAGKDHYLPDWKLYSPANLAPAAVRGNAQRWLVTTAQDDTDPHPGFWANLQAYANFLAAPLVVAGLTYQTKRHTDRETLTGTYRTALRGNLRFDPLECGPVIFRADINTLPTARRPLQGMTTMGQGRDMVLPHTALAYETVPAMPGRDVTSVMTTGACTVPNYIEKKAGQKAEFHHILGATLVEVDSEGVAWCRQIQARQDGSFYDLDVRVANGKVTRNHRVMGISWGDIHNPTVPANVFDWLWGARADSMIEALRPQHQIMNDLLDFSALARQEAGNPFYWLAQSARGLTGVKGQITSAAGFLQETMRDETLTVVVESNHDKRFEKWVDGERPRDAENLRFWYECGARKAEAAEISDNDFNMLRHALIATAPDIMQSVVFVPEGGSYRICPEVGGIEVGAHGHLGPNGARGNVQSLVKMGTRITIGHVHSPAIRDGVFASGMTGDLDQGYNKGPGSWRRAHVVHYRDGKRSIVTQAPDGRWRAG